jgi:hypothetical protein
MAMKRKIGLGIFAFFLLSALVGFIFFESEEKNIFSPLQYSVPASIGDPAPKIPPKPKHIATPKPVRGIYMTSWVAGTKDWRNRLVKMMDETEINAVVIDVKDYTGRIAFEVKDPELKETGAEEIRIPDIKEFIEFLHTKDIYVIARISVFQDVYLAKKRPDLAVKRKDGKTVWKDHKGIAWLNPASKEVWDYHVKIAKETEAVGFDELNFDYIRYPSDGNMKDIVLPYAEGATNKAESMKFFFAYLSEHLAELKIPLSADLFGFVTTNTDDLNIGQILENAVPYFDYICPMVYPSHYPRAHMGFNNPAEHPYEVIKFAMESAIQRLINQSLGLPPTATSTSPASLPTSKFKLLTSKLRPWLQDFDLGADYTAGMIRKQKQAVYDSGLDSWLLWDPANRYTREALD